MTTRESLCIVCGLITTSVTRGDDTRIISEIAKNGDALKIKSNMTIHVHCKDNFLKLIDNAVLIIK